jgi:hypothetical protein
VECRRRVGQRPCAAHQLEPPEERGKPLRSKASAARFQRVRRLVQSFRVTSFEGISQHSEQFGGVLDVQLRKLLQYVWFSRALHGTELVEDSAVEWIARVAFRVRAGRGYGIRWRIVRAARSFIAHKPPHSLIVCGTSGAADFQRARIPPFSRNEEDGEPLPPHDSHGNVERELEQRAEEGRIELHHIRRDPELEQFGHCFERRGVQRVEVILKRFVHELHFERRTVTLPDAAGK